MKRTLSLLLAVSCIFFLSRCGSTNSKTKYQISISAVPSEGGTVTPTSGQYKEGMELNLKATPSDHWKFDNWSGDAQGTSSSMTVTVTNAMNIKANFSKKQYDLTVNIDGKGTVDQKVIQTNVNSAKDYDYGTEVQLTAKPDSGWKFVKWTGDLTGADNPATITVKSAKTVTAVFEKKSYALTVKIDGKGTVDQKVIQTNVSSAKNYDYGTEVRLTAKLIQAGNLSSGQVI